MMVEARRRRDFFSSVSERKLKNMIKMLVRHPVPLTNTSDDCRPASGAIFSLSEGISVRKKKKKKRGCGPPQARFFSHFQKAFLRRKLKKMIKMLIRPAAGVKK